MREANSHSYRFWPHSVGSPSATKGKLATLLPRNNARRLHY